MSIDSADRLAFWVLVLILALILYVVIRVATHRRRRRPALTRPGARPITLQPSGADIGLRSIQCMICGVRRRRPGWDTCGECDVELRSLGRRTDADRGGL